MEKLHLEWREARKRFLLFCLFVFRIQTFETLHSAKLGSYDCLDFGCLLFKLAVDARRKFLRLNLGETLGQALDGFRESSDCLTNICEFTYGGGDI